MASEAYELPPARKIVVSNLPLKADLAGCNSAETAVEIVDEHIDPVFLFDGQFARSSVFTNTSVPSSTAGSGKLELAAVPGAGIVLPNGVNIYYLDMAPNYTTPLHRTRSVDYVTVLTGEVVLRTPSTAFDPATGKGEIIETICKPGDTVVQRGTLHGWANRTSGWIRLQGVVVDAEPIKTEVEDSEKMHPLPEVWIV